MADANDDRVFKVVVDTNEKEIPVITLYMSDVKPHTRPIENCRKGRIVVFNDKMPDKCIYNDLTHVFVRVIKSSIRYWDFECEVHSEHPYNASIKACDMMVITDALWLGNSGKFCIHCPFCELGKKE